MAGDRPGSRLRVLIDTSALADGRGTAGVGRYVSSLTGALQELGDPEVRLVQAPRPPFLESVWARYVCAQPYVVAAARSWKPGLVHATATDPVALLPLDRQVVTVHDVMAWTQPGHRRFLPTRDYLAYQRGRFRKCAAVIAVSEAVRDEAIEVLRLDPARVQVVPEGVSAVFTSIATDDDDALRLVAGTVAGPYVLWVGSMRSHDPRKAIDVLLAALLSLGPGRPRLVMAGSTGPESERIRGVARGAGLDVSFTGYVTDETLAALYRGAAVAVLPSLHDGFGLPAIEALACGAPLIVSSGGALEALVGRAALLVTPGSSDDLAQAIHDVLSDPGLQTSLRSAGPSAARPFSWQRAAQATADVYRLAAGYSPRAREGRVSGA